MEKLLIATHDSATGEKAGSFLSWLMIPFSRTQSKNIKEQLEAGSTMFDIRVKKHKDTWYCAHGLFRTKKTAWEVLSELNNANTDIYICVTYEGKLNGEEEKQEFLDWILESKSNYPNIHWGPVAAKYVDNNTTVDWITLMNGDYFPVNHQGFIPLDGKHWQTYLPIPWLWNLIYTRKHEFNTIDYTFVDFL